MATSGRLVDEPVHSFKGFDNGMDFGPFIAFQGELAWAYRKALFFRSLNVFYSLIPKNACTSLFSTLAVADGLTSPWFQSANRIHNVQEKFHAFRDVETFRDDAFKIVALRNPFKRLISAFNDKLVGTDPANMVHQRFFERRLNKKIEQCRLSEIVRVADRLSHWLVDKHFAPQWSFLFYDRYDLIIDADASIERIAVGKLELVLPHHNGKAKPYSDEDVGDVPIADIRQFSKERGQRPSLVGQHKIFTKSVRRGGNYERDYKLYDALA